MKVKVNMSVSRAYNTNLVFTFNIENKSESMTISILLYFSLSIYFFFVINDITWFQSILRFMNIQTRIFKISVANVQSDMIKTAL